MKSFLNNILSFSIVSFLPYIVNFIVLPIYGYYIDSEGFGIIGLIMSAASIASAWTGGQLSGALSRFYFDYRGKDLNEYISTIFFSTLSFCILFSVVYLLSAKFALFNGFITSADFTYVSYAVLLTCLSVINTLFERLLINEQKGRLVLIRSLYSQAASISVGVYLIVYKNMGVEGFLISSALYYVVLIFYSYRVTYNYFSFEFNRVYFIEAVKYSAPLIFHALGGVVFMYGTVFFIKAFLSLSFVGVFFICDKFTQVIKALVNGVNNVLMPIYNKISVKDETLGRSFISNVIPLWFLICSTIVINFSFVAQAFLLDFMGEEYSEMLVVIGVLTCSYLFRGLYCFSVAPLFFHKKTELMPKITFVTGVVSLALNVILIPYFGIVGAALAVFCSFLVNFMISLYYSNKVSSVDFKYFNLCLIFIFVVLSNVPVLLMVQECGFYVSFIASIFLTLTTCLIAFYFGFFQLKDSYKILREMNANE